MSFLLMVPAAASAGVREIAASAAAALTTIERFLGRDVVDTVSLG